MLTFQSKLENPLVYQISPTPKGNCVTCLDVDEKYGWIISGQMSGTINAWKLPELKSDPFIYLRSNTIKQNSTTNMTTTITTTGTTGTRTTGTTGTATATGITTTTTTTTIAPTLTDININTQINNNNNNNNNDSKENNIDNSRVNILNKFNNSLESSSNISNSTQIRTRSLNGLFIKRYHKFDCRNLNPFDKEFVQYIRVLPSINGRIIAMIGFSCIKIWKNILESENCLETIYLKNTLSEFNVNGYDSLMCIYGERYLRIFCYLHKKIIEIDLLHNQTVVSPYTQKTKQQQQQPSQLQQIQLLKEGREGEEEKGKKKEFSSIPTNTTATTTSLSTSNPHISSTLTSSTSTQIQMLSQTNSPTNFIITPISTNITTAINIDIRVCHIDDEIQKEYTMVGGNDNVLICHCYKKKFKDKDRPRAGTFVHQSVHVRQLMLKPTEMNKEKEEVEEEKVNSFPKISTNVHKSGRLYELKEVKVYDKLGMYNHRRRGGRREEDTRPQLEKNTEINATEQKLDIQSTNDKEIPKLNPLLNIRETSWGFLVDGDTMAYVLSTNSNIVRIVRWNEEKADSDMATMRNQESANVLYEHNNGRGFIVTMEYKDGILITLSSDRRLCVYREDQRIAMATNILGTFIPGYAYIVKRSVHASNVIYYTADEGIFVIEF